MVFSSPVFLFFFLPLTLVFYGLASLTGRIAVKNAVLLVMSIVFYGYGGLNYLGLLAVSVVVNWAIGLAVDAWKPKKAASVVFLLGIVWNTGILVVLKYLNLLGDTAAWIAGMISGTEMTSPIPEIVLPIGISFFTFQIMSYLIDVYRGKTKVQRNIADLALYIMLFPQLIAGPIVRYTDVEGAIRKRGSSLDDVYEGAFRFMVGFFKKVLLANEVGKAADLAFALKPGMGMIYAWIGIVCYSLQIYLDFWAYSDMAIGLGRMFGFRFPENFDDPYCARSISEFWRRWHMTLSGWFRDYVYIPLGGSRCSIGKNCRNYLIVFALTGIWHGASWNFLFWGLYFACFLIAERLGLLRLVERLPGLLRRLYVILVVGVGWVFFRADNLTKAIGYLQEMVCGNPMGSLDRELAEYVTGPKFILLFVVSLLFCTPFFRKAHEKLQRMGAAAVCDAVAVVLFFLAACEMMAGTYNPFIYFRF
ncbi:MAG: MBOAT family protein [Clostridiales bacterium]|nr:MBOAT family protein [Clostridiales bacterium]